LALGNLKEMYGFFKSKFAARNFRFSKSAELCIQHCVSTGGSGTHSICVCSVHQNVKLMKSGSEQNITPAEDDVPLKSHKICTELCVIHHNPHSVLCECPLCPDINSFQRTRPKVLLQRSVTAFRGMSRKLCNKIEALQAQPTIIPRGLTSVSSLC
jgi:hypothetical protein